MTDRSDAQRPHEREHEPAPDEQQQPQEALDRDMEGSGGDADAAGTVDERETVAKDEPDAFGEPESSS
jgi:hypothetical protein